MSNSSYTKPFLKWAGGKGQLIDRLNSYIPTEYEQYIEPFLGGGALFFYLRPQKAILSDINPELINCYSVVRDNIEDLIEILQRYKNEETFYYELRSTSLDSLSSLQRAARFIYLNKTCFNGLYRENKKGEFNVPFAYYKNPTICDKEKLRLASKVLQNAKLICADYKVVIRRYAQEGDFVFLDPPYVPVGATADFKRYTKDFFYDADHIELRDEFNYLEKIGANVVLTNSNTDFVRALYANSKIELADTKRLISSNANTRNGEDLIISSTKRKKNISTQHVLLEKFPSTRYMGSKYKILPFLWDCLKDLEFSSVLDAFAGSNCVSYMFKMKGYEVYSNDFSSFSSITSKAIIENADTQIDAKELEQLLIIRNTNGGFITTTFEGLYFDREDNIFLDNVRANIDFLEDEYKKAIALSALIRACMKKRPRGIFTYIGERYNDGRRDLQMSLKEHFIDNIEAFNNAVFDNKRTNKTFCSDIFNLSVNADLVYLDPPYLTSKSDNDYIRRYHFVEGLVKNWKGLSIDYNTKTKKFKSYRSLFDSKNTVYDALDTLFQKHQNSILVVSYSSNSIPSKEEMVALLKKYKQKVEIKEIDYKYSFGNQGSKVGNNSNKVKEYIFIAE